VRFFDMALSHHQFSSLRLPLKTKVSVVFSLPVDHTVPIFLDFSMSQDEFECEKRKRFGQDLQDELDGSGVSIILSSCQSCLKQSF
jgi:hypothetical protein